MNRNIIITAALAAGASLLVYLAGRKRKEGKELQQLPAKGSRHITDLFTKAKYYHSHEGKRVTMSDKI